MRNRYRIVRDNHCGFEAQVRFWWFPFAWFQLATSGRGLGTNTCSSVAEARAVAVAHRNGPPPAPPVPSRVVEYLEDV
jgi:hypothetical protein